MAPRLLSCVFASCFWLPQYQHQRGRGINDSARYRELDDGAGSEQRRGKRRADNDDVESKDGTYSTPQQRDDNPPNDSTNDEEDKDDELKQTNSCLSIGMSTLGCTVDNNDALISDTITAATNKASVGDWKKRQPPLLQIRLLLVIGRRDSRINCKRGN